GEAGDVVHFRPAAVVLGADIDETDLERRVLGEARPGRQPPGKQCCRGKCQFGSHVVLPFIPVTSEIWAIKRSKSRAARPPSGAVWLTIRHERLAKASGGVDPQ